MAKPNGYDALATIMRKFREYESMQPIFCTPASAKHNSPDLCDMTSELGRLTVGADNRISRSVPSKLDHSIFGLSRFQSDQYNLLQMKLCPTNKRKTERKNDD